jgi:hypothetical protein
MRGHHYVTGCYSSLNPPIFFNGDIKKRHFFSHIYNKQTVLLVDDEPKILELVKSYLFSVQGCFAKL